MTPKLANATLVLLAVGWYIIRFPYARRSRHVPVARSVRGPREIVLLLASSIGLGLLPLLYISFGFPQFGDSAFSPVRAWIGVFVALASLIMFRLTHRALAGNWSMSLDVREQHTLVIRGVYERVRHPMYTAFWLWAAAQALLLPNRIAGFAGLVGFGMLFFGRVAQEEQMMVEKFGDEYRAYVSRTYRLIPWIY